MSFLRSCPVCNRNLSEFGSPAAQEEHVKACLDGGVGSIQQPPKYLVYNLPGESLLIGTECTFHRKSLTISCHYVLICECCRCYLPGGIRKRCASSDTSIVSHCLTVSFFRVDRCSPELFV